jgi:hypothetical protein
MEKVAKSLHERLDWVRLKRSNRSSSALTIGSNARNALAKASAAASGATPRREPGGTLKSGKSIRPDNRARPTAHGESQRLERRQIVSDASARAPQLYGGPLGPSGQVELDAHRREPRHLEDLGGP